MSVLSLQFSSSQASFRRRSGPRVLVVINCTVGFGGCGALASGLVVGFGGVGAHRFRVAVCRFRVFRVSGCSVEVHGILWVSTVLRKQVLSSGLLS